MGDTHNDKNFYRKAREARKGALRFFFAYLRALGDLGGRGEGHRRESDQDHDREEGQQHDFGSS